MRQVTLTQIAESRLGCRLFFLPKHLDLNQLSRHSRIAQIRKYPIDRINSRSGRIAFTRCQARREARQPAHPAPKIVRRPSFDHRSIQSPCCKPIIKNGNRIKTFPIDKIGFNHMIIID
ncbi:hypothetical protein [Burkholderia metallica]